VSNDRPPAPAGQTALSAPGRDFPNEYKFIPPRPLKVKKKVLSLRRRKERRTGSAQPCFFTRPDLDEEPEDLEEDELDRPDDAERLEEDERLDFGAL
jgi:hypothetical protein